MTWLFVRFYVGVLIALLLAWFVHGKVWTYRSEAETARVFVAAHGGGARLVVQELEAAPPESREQTLKRLREPFRYPLVVVPCGELPSGVQSQFAQGEDIAYFRLGDREHYVAAALSHKKEAVRLGPFPDYRLAEIEDALGGWMRLTTSKVDAGRALERRNILDELQQEFDFPVEMTSLDKLPSWPRNRLVQGETVAFYSEDPPPTDRWFAASPLADGTEVLRFGPFPSFERLEQKAAATTLALVLAPVALAIALLLRPVARQLRKVEHAAQAIAAGDLTARVDERRVRSAKSLAHAFNHMASRTEALVRTQRELLQAVSHELRTPLSRIRFAIDLVGTATDEEQRRQRLESLDAAADELDGLVGELLTYVRMETSRVPPEREPLDIREVLDLLVERHAVLHPSIQFEVCNRENGDVLLVADRTGLQRVIGNLLSNAARFARSRVTITAHSTDHVVVINIDDDGSGIPIAERQRVFEPFVRLDNNPNGRGVGLGLTLVQRIMKQHGGSVEVYTSPLGGCRVQTTWPTHV